MTNSTEVKRRSEVMREFVNGLLKTSKRLLCRDGVVNSIAMLHNSNTQETTFVAMPFKDTHEKALMSSALRSLVHKFGADIVVYVGEAWMIIQKKDKELPKDIPKRSDIIVVCGVTADDTYSLVQPFLKEGDQYIFQEVQEQKTTLFNRFVGDLWTTKTIN